LTELIKNGDIKQAYDECFSSETEPPYSLFVKMHCGTRQKLDIKLNKKLNKQFDVNQIKCIEVEFLMSADFVRMRSDFNKVFN